METQDQNNKAQPSENGSDGQLKSRDDKREHNIDANLSISEMREAARQGDKLEDQPAASENGAEEDAMNYKSDRDHGAYNSKRS